MVKYYFPDITWLLIKKFYFGKLIEHPAFFSIKYFRKNVLKLIKFLNTIKLVTSPYIVKNIIINKKIYNLIHQHEFSWNKYGKINNKKVKKQTVLLIYLEKQ